MKLKNIYKSLDIDPKKVLVINTKNKGFYKIFTPSRIYLLEMIIKRKPKSIKELCNLVKRSEEAVSYDLKILENYGLLSLTQVGKQKKPEIEKDILMIPLTA